jgi:hypothetical protein
LERLGIAPGDHEHLLALGEQVLDEASPRGEVEDVELVDRRRDDEQRDLADLRAARLVVDELEDLVAQDHRAGSDRQVLADRERRRVDAGGQARRGREVADELARPARQSGASVVDEVLEHRRVRPREVGGRQRVEDVGCGEAGSALGAPVGFGIGDQAVDGAARREVGL